MSLKIRELSVLAYANGFSLWHYGTPDTSADVGSTGYFNAAGGQLRAGDILIATTERDSNPSTALYAVTTAEPGNVAIAGL